MVILFYFDGFLTQSNCHPFTSYWQLKRHHCTLILSDMINLDGKGQLLVECKLDNANLHSPWLLKRRMAKFIVLVVITGHLIEIELYTRHI